MLTSNIFADALFWFFAMVGVFSIAADVFSLISSRLSTGTQNASLVLFVKNCQDSIEGTMRKLIQTCSHPHRSSVSPTITVIDLGSDDDTPQILSHLAHDYEFISITSKEEYIEQIKSIT